ncbi:MAG: hypothetical protein EOM10_06465 [Opitutae bacterium]|nr:hypothetical protein [Opitutae bacterium]
MCDCSGPGLPTPPLLNPIGNKAVAPGSDLQFNVVATPTDADAVTLTASNLPSGSTFDATNELGSFVWEAAGPTGVYSVTIYATDKDGTDEETIAITVSEQTPVDPTCAVIISEYVEGSSNNKAVEIYNPTASAIDLAAGQYVVQIYANGSATPQAPISLTGTLASQDGFVLVNTTAGATLLALADQTSVNLGFNGDDAVVLRVGGASGTVLDSIGQVGVDPGTMWGSGDTSTLDHTLRRKTSVKSGDLVIDNSFDPATEWDGYATDVFDNLGSHTNDCSGPALPTPPILNPVGNQSVTVDENLEFQVVATPTDGDAVTLTASNLPAGATFNATNEIGTFQWLAASPTGVYGATFYATDKDGTDEETISITVGEASAELLAPVIQPATGIQATQFYANWLAAANATGYLLDVGTNETFSGGDAPAGSNLMSNAGFETGDSTDWDKFETEYAVVGTDPQEGIYHVDCTATGTRDLMQAVDVVGDGLSPFEVSFYYKKPSATGNARIWATWAAGGQVSGDLLTPTNYLPVAADWTRVAYTVVPQSGANVLNFEVRTYTGATVSWDNFFVGGVPAGRKAASYVPGYEHLDVGDVTTFAVTGLTESVTYYYRVQAYNASSNSPYSAVTSVVTQAASGEQPDITGFEVPAGATAVATLATSQLGQTYVLQYTLDLMADPVVWEDADSEVGTGLELVLEDETPSDARRFYRVVVQ